MGNDCWDAVIVGAGPAGGVCASLLARRGWRVLLVERAAWPREKVCGGCINAAALALLRDAGFAAVPRGAGGNRLDRFALNVRGRRLELPLPPGMALPRATLDERLVDDAVKHGCRFIPGATAALMPASDDRFRELRLAAGGTREILRARLVLACDGISGTLLEHEPWATWRVARTSWFGVSATLEDAAVLVDPPPSAIGMCVGTGGYAGLVRYGDGRAHLAAALDVHHCRATGGPALLIKKIMRECGAPLLDPGDTAKFHGTGLLTRRRPSLGGHRVLAVGDACGYVEPFTGEGIAWAIRGAREVVALLPASPDQWPVHLPLAWAGRHRAAIRARQRACRLLRMVLHHPRLATAAVAAAALFPAIGGVIARRIGRAPPGAIESLTGAAE